MLFPYYHFIPFSMFFSTLQSRPPREKRNAKEHLNIEVNVEFIMDGANPGQETAQTFPIQLDPDPKFLPHTTTDTMSFHPQPLCNEDTIHIRVRLIWSIKPSNIWPIHLKHYKHK